MTLEMMQEVGYCIGHRELFPLHFDGRHAGYDALPPARLFPEGFSGDSSTRAHVTVPQIRAMYGGDNSRKVNLVEYGFRLPAAIDNRPLTFARV